MFPELNSILNTSPNHVKQREFILLSDRKTDASFLIHHFLSFYLKAHSKVCFLGLVQSFSHYTAVGQKLGVNLVQARERGQLVFVEALKASPAVLLNESTGDLTQALDYLSCSPPELQSLYKFVCSALNQNEAEESHVPPVLIIDDLSVLLSLGVSVRAILDFMHYCQLTVSSQMQGSIVTLVRCDDDDDEEEEDSESSGCLLKALTHQCTLAMNVEGLSTGYCKDIHGQVEIWWREKGEAVQTRRKIFQYKVRDKGASFFAPGTSSAVL